jgi:hypothetical protein
MNDSKQAEKTEREEGLELALTLMGASAEGLAHTTNTLIDNLTAERGRATSGTERNSRGDRSDAVWPVHADFRRDPSGPLALGAHDRQVQAGRS